MSKNNRRGRMKQIDVKRAMLLVSSVCVVLFFYLYWQQSVGTHNIINKYKEVYRTYKKTHPPLWTWECVNKRCERHFIKPDTPPTSFGTCEMLCGSTQLWPQPTGPVKLGSKSVTFNHRQIQFENFTPEPGGAFLEKTFAVFNDNIISLVQNRDYLKDKTDIRKFIIKVEVEQPKELRLKLKTDESYTLAVKTTDEGSVVAEIQAKSCFGARHGLESLSQLIWWDNYSNGGTLRILKRASIQDRPAFPYRGLMIDTARNFMSVEAIKRVLTGMAASKLNVFHWHIADSQSFPLLTPRVPQLAKYGAYDTSMIYTPEEVLNVVDYAKTRGIRIIIEVDTPAHAGNGWTWGPEAGLGNLALCVNEKPWSAYCGEPPCGQLNPDNPNVLTVLEKLYKDLLELTNDDELFHIGGDEVNLECWGEFVQRTTLSNYSDLHDLWGEFTLKILNSLKVANGNKQIPNIIIWSSNLSKRPYISRYLNKDNIIVQSWGSSKWSDTPDLIADGYRVILSHVDAWYLDCGFGRWRETGDAACDPYRPWQTVYTHRPWQQLNLNKNQIVGGETCLWSEQVDEGSLDARLWPRAAAFAERMWSDSHVNEALSIEEDVYTRLDTHRDRLISRGLGAEALWPLWCKHNPGMCL